MPNGREAATALEPLLPEFDGLRAKIVSLPNWTFDLSAYIGFATEIKSGPVCFLNTHSQPLAEGWLAKMLAHLKPGVGIVGATGSWESPYTSLLRARPLFGASWRFPPPLPQLREWWALYRYRRWYPPFPNPHLRTNAFLMRAEDLVSLAPPRLRTKRDCLRLEAGWDGLTRAVQARGQQALVVGRNGEAYAPPQWDQSETYRSGGQENLLIADNRTRGYMEADEDTKRLWRSLAWGKDR